MCKKCSNNSCDGCCETVISKVGPKGPKGDKGTNGTNGATGPAGPAGPPAFDPVNFRAQNNALQSFTDAAPTATDATLTYTVTVAGKYSINLHGKIKLDPNGDPSCGLEVTIRLNGIPYISALVSRFSLESPLEESWDTIALPDQIDLVPTDVITVFYQKTVSGPLSVSSFWVGVLSLFKIED